MFSFFFSWPLLFFLDRFLGREPVFFLFLFFLIAFMVESVFFLFSFINSHLRLAAKVVIRDDEMRRKACGAAKGGWLDSATK